MSEKFRLRVSTIRLLVKGKIEVEEVAEILGCSTRSVRRYFVAYVKYGPDGLKDQRSSNNFKLTDEQKNKIKKLKRKNSWRSSRNIKDKLKLDISERRVQQVLRKAGLNHQNVERVKPITRFQAACPNDLWQADIMGKITLPKLGTVYLIGTLDDHSRFVPAAKFFKSQHKVNVFMVWMMALIKHGLPIAMLHDRGSQYKANTSYGQADYQRYAQALGIQLIWASKAQTKGKIERFWRFVQDDFIRDVWQVSSMKVLNTKFQKWLHFYNCQYHSKYFGNKTHAECYQDSSRKLTKAELIKTLTIEERRKVTRESTISLYGQTYVVPRGYINCRIWIKIFGYKLYFVANDKIIHKTDIKN